MTFSCCAISRERIFFNLSCSDLRVRDLIFCSNLSSASNETSFSCHGDCRCTYKFVQIVKNWYDIIPVYFKFEMEVQI